MKKPYEKPMLYVEDFSLSEHIAIGCKLIDQQQGAKDFTTPQACIFEWGGVKMFMGSGNCASQGAIILDPTDSSSAFCYHGPSAERLVFSS